MASTGTFITTSLDAAVFSLVDDGVAAPIVVSDSDHAGVVRVARDLAADLARVTGVAPTVSIDGMPVAREVVVVGTIGRCPYIDDLLRKGRLDAAAIVGQWETSLQQVVTDPWPGVERAFVIAGSDQRGTIFGAYEVSKQVGISPWYWWDDVPAPHRDALYVRPGAFTQGTPAVRYRGFFINDENPNLGTWAPRFFGPGHADGYPDGFNHGLYAKVFEVLLRLKGNCLWPAVWNRAFAEDDPDNHATATAYGVIMGTSHEAPMMRAIDEWNRHPSGSGEWSFRRNAPAIERFWREGIRRMRDEGVEGIVTLGMRGNGDVSLPDGDGIELMEAILAGQRDILSEFGMASLPQVFMLYKEVQRYWDRGLRPPEDVTVLFADDNWGNLRKLPDQSLPRRAGGYGLYYHFDYVGGGRSYKWVDTTNLPNTWEQLNLTFTHGVDRLWVANVGDLKGAELPLQFFLDFAWKPIALEDIAGWERAYAAQNFGGAIAHEIAEVLHEYGRLQARRKPELLNRRIHFDEVTKEVTHDDEASPFSLINYGEIDRVTSEWERLASTVDALEAKLPAEYTDSFFELVGYPVKACANLYALRRAEFLNRRYADQGRAAANDLADAADARFADDRALTDRFDSLAEGKWRGFQRQAHIGYGDVARYGPEARWQQPERNHAPLPDEIFPPVRRIALPGAAAMSVAIDGSDGWWPGLRDGAVLPTFSPYQSQPPQYLEVFNRGRSPFSFEISAGAPWLEVTPVHGTVETQVRATVRVDWTQAPQGTTIVPLTITGSEGTTVVVEALVDHSMLDGARGFVEANGYVSINADHYSRSYDGSGVSWLRIPDLGRTGSGMAVVPVTADRVVPGPDTPRLEYDVTLTSRGPVTVWAYLAPRNNVLDTEGLRYAVSIDDQPPQVVDIIAATGADDTGMNWQWARNTSDNVNRTATRFIVERPGVHVLTFWMVDPTVVLQNLIVDTGGLRHSYLGPPESRWVD